MSEGCCGVAGEGLCGTRGVTSVAREGVGPATDGELGRAHGEATVLVPGGAIELAEGGRTAHVAEYLGSLPTMRRVFDRLARKRAFAGGDAHAWLAWRDDARTRLRGLLGLDLMEPCSPEGRVTERVRIARNGSAVAEGSPDAFATRERILVQVQPGEWMPTYALIPDDRLRAADGRALVVLCPHGHQGAGKLAVAGVRGIGAVEDALAKFDYDYGLKLARLGYVALCPDARGSGERRDAACQGDEDQKFMRCSDVQLAHMVEPLGLTVIGMLTWDLMRLVDYVGTRREWSLEDLGCVGFSGGGMQTLWLSALDERVRWAIVSGYLYGVRDSLLELNNNCSCNYVPGLWRSYDMGDVASLVAPRPLVVQSCTEDHLNGCRGVANADEQVAVARAAYELLGAAGSSSADSEGPSVVTGSLRHDHHPGPHHFCGDLLADEVAWVKARLAGEGRTAGEGHVSARGHGPAPATSESSSIDALFDPAGCGSVSTSNSPASHTLNEGKQAMRVFIAGDSTCAPKLGTKRPETGWGERLGCYFDNEVQVINHAHNGESTKSFIACGRFDAVAEDLAAGDWLFIQFAHNDEHARPVQHTEPYVDFTANLTRFVELAREKGAHPVLLTPIARRKFGEDGVPEDTHRDYADATRKLAAKLQVPLIDLTVSTTKLLAELGPDRSVRLFNHGELGEYFNYPEGVDDHTHLCPHGAFVIAGLAARGVREAGLEPLAAHLVESPVEPEPETGDGAFPVDQHQFEVSRGQTASFERADGEPTA